MKLSKKLFLPLVVVAALGMTGCNVNKTSSTSGGTQTSSTSGTKEVTKANGVKNLTGISYDDKVDILAQMEGYANKNHLTGVPLYGSGGYTLINDRCDLPLNKGTDGKGDYVTNYGFGLLREGNITTTMSATNEPNSNWGLYYHTATSQARNKMNPMDADDNSLATMTGYITSTFWSTRLKTDTAGKYTNDYEFYPSYADCDAPTMVDDGDSDTNSSTTWTFKVKTGANSGLKFKTKSTKTVNGVAINTFNDKAVTVEDYIFAMKMLLTQSNGYSYSSQYSSDVSNIVGATDYYNSTEKTIGTADNEEKWNNVGYTKVDDETIKVKFVYPTDAFGCMYRMDNNLIAPCNKDFYQTICGTIGSENFKPALYGTYNSDQTITPADSILSCGPYILSEYDSVTNNEIVFDKNPDWLAAEEPTKVDKYYRIPGVKISINSAMKTDPSANYNNFKAGSVDVSSIPASEATNESSDSTYKHFEVGDSVWKLQVNNCTQTEWDGLFGTEGTVDQAKSTDDYYKCKPIMANDNFVNGVYASINRSALATLMNADVANSFFSDAYETAGMNADGTISHKVYNDTDAHKKVMEDYFPDTYGYSLEGAKTLFGKAIDEELANGDYTAGTADTPTEIHVQVAYQAASQLTDEGAYVKKNIEDAFNAVGTAKGVKLVIDLFAPDNWYDVYYSMCLVGQFDFCFASISGGTLDPFNFLNTLRSDNQSTFTLSWGCDTNECTGEIVYNNESYSYNAMYDAVEYGNVNIVDGCEAAN